MFVSLLFSFVWALLDFARQVFPFSQAKRWQYDSLEGESLSLSDVNCGFYLGTSLIHLHIMTVFFFSFLVSKNIMIDKAAFPLLFKGKVMN